MMKALVTGASSGIGRAIAVELARRGYYVINASRRRECKEGGVPTDILVNGCFIKSDLCDLCEVENLVSQVSDVSVLVHNAGFMYLTNDYDSEMFDRMVSVALKSPFFLTKRMIDEGKLLEGGVVVFISSVSGIYGEPDDIPYGAVKAGMIAMMKGFAKRYRSYRFVAIAPGLVDTWLVGDPRTNPPPKEIVDRIIVGRPGKPEEVAKLVVHVVENEFINCEVITIDGGRL